MFGIPALFWNADKSLRNNIFSILCFCLVESAFFTNIIHLRKTGSQLQLTELVFLALVFFIPYKSVLNHMLKNNNVFSILISLFIIVDLLTSAKSGQVSAVAGSFGRLYLFCIFIILSYHFNTFTKDELFKRLTIVITISSIALILISAVGYLLLSVGIKTSFLWPAGNYPYFGVIYRLSGPNQYPTMMISQLTFIIIYYLGAIKTASAKKIICGLLVLLSICALATLSKSLVLLIMALVILMLKHFQRLNRVTFTICVLAFSGVMIFFTHFIVVKQTPDAIAGIEKTIYTSNRIVYQDHDYAVFEANYLTLKYAAVRIFKNHPWFGIGTGNFSNQLAIDKQNGLYPKKLPDFEPQTTLLRAFAENGIFGGVLMVCIFAYVTFKFLQQPWLVENDMLFALFLIFVVLVTESISTDIYNFRHLWLLFALTFVYINHKTEINPSSTA